jgi:hypothetical protein
MKAGPTKKIIVPAPYMRCSHIEPGAYACVEGFDLPLAVPSFVLRSLLFMFATAAVTFIVPLPDLPSCHDFPVACIPEAVLPCYSRQAAPERTTKLGDLSPSPADIFVEGVLSGEDEQQLLCRASSWTFCLFVSISPCRNESRTSGQRSLSATILSIHLLERRDYLSRAKVKRMLRKC